MAKGTYSNDQYDPNRNLAEATYGGNASNTRAISSFNSTAENMTNNLNNQSNTLTGNTRNSLNNAYQNYNQDMQNYSNNMGQADQDIHTRNRGQAYAGLDSGFGDASNELQASLARRGMSNSGVGAKAMGDLSQDRMRAGAEAGVNAYTSAIDMSDSRRQNRMNTRGNLYGAEQGNLNNDYQMGMANLGQNYGNSMAVRGQALQNTLNNNQQRIGNLMGYAQLGRGMAGMSQNYLQQAGSGYTNIGGQAGQTAIGIGGLNNSYNSTMQQAQSSNNAKGGEALGTAIGTASMFSDARLKTNLRNIGRVGPLNVYTWEWNENGKIVSGDKSTVGFIAQEVEKVYPHYVEKDKETGYLKVNYGAILKGQSIESLIGEGV